MTRDEFIAYAVEVTSHEALEPLFDQIAEYRSECAMFGDAGPGAGSRIQESIAQLRRIAAQYQRLTGDPLPLPKFF